MAKSQAKLDTARETGLIKLSRFVIQAKKSKKIIPY